MAKTKFSNNISQLNVNPAGYILHEADKEKEPAAAEHKLEFDYSKYHEEKRDQRLQLVVTPTLKKALKERAEAEDTSVNDYVHRLLEAVLLGK